MRENISVGEQEREKCLKCNFLHIPARFPPVGNKVRMEQCQNARVWKTGDPRENPPTRGIFLHDSHLRKSESEHSNRSATAAPAPLATLKLYIDFVNKLDVQEFWALDEWLNVGILVRNITRNALHRVKPALALWVEIYSVTAHGYGGMHAARIASLEQSQRAVPPTHPDACDVRCCCYYTMKMSSLLGRGNWCCAVSELALPRVHSTAVTGRRQARSGYVKFALQPTTLTEKMNLSVTSRAVEIITLQLFQCTGTIKNYSRQEFKEAWGTGSSPPPQDCKQTLEGHAESGEENRHTRRSGAGVAGGVGTTGRTLSRPYSDPAVTSSEARVEKAKGRAGRVSDRAQIGLDHAQLNISESNLRGGNIHARYCIRLNLRHPSTWRLKCMRTVECFQDLTLIRNTISEHEKMDENGFLKALYLKVYTQYDEKTARQFRALRLVAMGDLIRVAVSPLTLPRLSASNAEKALGRIRILLTRFPRLCIPALLHTHLISPVGSQDIVVKSGDPWDPRVQGQEARERYGRHLHATLALIAPTGRRAVFPS
ncbi:hypothetical protein PR048_004695 [Dryococelus australis]|uniref:Uncharacterized protein n=1 Tax=Dryococelus australis TaxID=614101 RepID=A0ABQ9I660_9NEOP|nr:hypothetical protein PR048_004695 [Dryococelus australis]